MTDQTTASSDQQQWQVVDEGWGRKAVDFAALAEPTNCREYVTVQHRLGVGAGDRLLDIACGAGLALELAALRGARCAGIDASPRLVAVARDRSPEADLRVGDMNALPWDDDTFDVVTSFRGIWGTTPHAVAEAFRVLSPGGRLGLTVWGHIKVSPGAWALAPFALAPEPKVQNQADMVALGRPGAGEALLAEVGFTDIERIEVPFVFEFSDPEIYARVLSAAPQTEAAQRLFKDDLEDVGYVRNVSRLWAHNPRALDGLSDLLGETTSAGPLTFRQRAVLITAAAAALGDSYCSLAWGKRLSEVSSPGVAAAVIEGGAQGLADDEKALAHWARLVARDPNAITEADVDALRSVGFDDGQIFAITTFVSLRLAFAAVNDALGAKPDGELADAAPEEVRMAVTFGRPPDQKSRKQAD